MDLSIENELAGQIARVTGSSKGTGRAIADRLLKAGASVFPGVIMAPVGNDEQGTLLPSILLRGFPINVATLASKAIPLTDAP